jgi:hypothetical protein
VKPLCEEIEKKGRYAEAKRKELFEVKAVSPGEAE